MDDFDFIEDDDLDNVDDISFDDFIFNDIDDMDDIDDSNDQCDEILDNEFIDSHFNIVPSTVIENFPFIEDDVDAITDYELFSKGFEYLDDKKADKSEIPDVSDYVKKDTTELENYPLTSSLSDVAFSGDYDDLSDKPTIPTKTSDLDNDSGFITKDVNDLTNYTLTTSLATVATTGSYSDLSNKPTIPTVPSNVSAFTNDAGYITKDVNDLTNYTLTSSLSTVATSGSYNDLSNKPTIPDVSNMVTTDTDQDITGLKTIKNVVKIENGQGTGSMWVGGNVNSNTVTNNQRHLARIAVPSYSDVTLGTTLLGFDSSGDNDMNVTNKTYDTVSFGGMKKITNATSPLSIGFCVATERNATAANKKVYPLEMDSTEARFNVQPNYNGKNILTTDSVGNAKFWYGTSTTAAATQTKVVTCSGFTLETGASIIVKFTNKQSYNGQPKLNVNSTGAINIQYKGGTSGIRYMWNDGSTLQFVYDGTNWISEGRDIANTTYYGVTKLNDTTTSTSVNMAATANAVKKTYDYAATKQDAITSTNKLDYSLIDNTPTIPTVPTNVSAFTNDSGYITKSVSDLTNYTTTTALTALLSDKENKSTIGSNYIKFDNGLLICWDSVATSTAITESFGGFYRSGDLTPFSNFPVTFISTPVITVNVQATSGYPCWSLKGYPPSTTNANNLRVYGTWSTTQNITFSYIAIGKWK